MEMCRAKPTEAAAVIIMQQKQLESLSESNSVRFTLMEEFGVRLIRLGPRAEFKFTKTCFDPQTMKLPLTCTLHHLTRQARSSVF